MKLLKGWQNLMQPINQYKEEINIKALDNTLAAIYGASSLLSAKKRYLTALDEFSNLFELAISIRTHMQLSILQYFFLQLHNYLLVPGLLKLL